MMRIDSLAKVSVMVLIVFFPYVISNLIYI